jgi:hypothetical protein
MDTTVRERLTLGFRQWVRAGRLARVALVAAAVLPAAAGCTSAQIDNGTSPSYLIISSLQGASGATPSQFSNTLASDVVTLVKASSSSSTSGSSSLVPTVFADPGKVTFTLALKDPGAASSPTSPTPANFITVTRYHVEYVRADGRNTPGVDVPYPFDGAMTLTVDTGGGIGTFTLVREQAKEEAPLKALVGGGGADVISTIANVTFYGTDQAGRSVSVTGSIGITFADWGDPQ